MKKSFVLLCAVLLMFGMVLNAGAVQFSGSQVSSNQWTYDLTYNPNDNYSLTQQYTTITLTGLFGVTSATGPVSTDFPTTYLDDLNLQWSAEVLAGGTSVRWTHNGPGTGNFQVDKHVYGFSVFAAGAVDGLASLATDGFSTDNQLGFHYDERDITGTVSGPHSAPVPEPATFLLLGSGLAGLAFYRRKRK